MDVISNLNVMYPEKHIWCIEYRKLETTICQICENLGSLCKNENIIVRFGGMFCVCLSCFDKYYNHEDGPKKGQKYLYHHARSTYLEPYELYKEKRIEIKKKFGIEEFIICKKIDQEIDNICKENIINAVALL